MSKSKHQLQSDFIKNLPLFNNKSKLIQNNFILFLKSYPQNTKEPILNMKIIKKNGKIFFKDFNYEKFNELKLKIGLECNLNDFMKSFINNIKEEKNIIIEEINKFLLMKIIFNISNGIKINVVINFEDSIDCESKIFNNILMEILFNLYDEKNEIENQIKNKNKNLNLNNEIENNIEKFLLNNENNNLDLMNIVNFIENKKNISENKKNEYENNNNKKKRKYRANLINPNIKKRNKKAISYVSEEDEDENNDDNNDNNNDDNNKNDSDNENNKNEIKNKK